MHPSLSHTAHRPWPLPSRPWTWRQRWEHLLFAHWAVPAGLLRPHVPHRLTIQEFDGSAWLAVVPFVLAKLAPRGLPPVPGLNTFPELNLRTYVEVDGVPGVWFFSLDASNPFAVWAANNVFSLPYHRAQIQLGEASGRIDFESKRAGSGVGCSVSYGAAPGSVERWLTERYCVYAMSRRGRLIRTQVHHEPWPLQQGEADFRRLDLGAPFGLDLRRPPELVHYSRGVPVVLWPGERVP